MPKMYRNSIGCVINKETANDRINYTKAIVDLITKFVPSSLSLIIEYSVFFLNIVFVGMLNDPILMSGCGLGGMTANIVVFSVDIGICGGLDTLVSQAFGRKDYNLCKAYLNVCRITVALLFIPQLILLGFSEQLFVLIGQPPESAAISWKYIMLILPGIFLNMQFECTRRYLLTIGICNPIMYIFGVTFIVHLICLTLFVIVFNFGIIGIGISTAITYSMDFILITLYTQLKLDSALRPSWNFTDPTILKCIHDFLKYGVPACLMLLLEWWTFEIIIIYSGWLGIKQLAACAILNNIILISVEIPYGISLTSSCLVGNNLGANLPSKAKTYAVSTLILGFFISVGISIIFCFYSKKIMVIYTKDEEELEIINSSLLLYTIQFSEFMFSSCLNGIMRGIGYQHIATILSIVSYWIIDLPLAYILLFVYDFDFMGIWIAFPIGNFVLLTGYILIILTAPWSELAQLASEETNSLLISEDSICISSHKVKLKASLKEACILELEKMEYLIELKTNDFK